MSSKAGWYRSSSGALTNDSRGLNKPRFLFLSARWARILNHKAVVSISYLLSIVIVYHYLQLRGKSEVSTSHYDTETMYVIPDSAAKVSEPMETFQRYRYHADSILLPNAPYKHIRKNLDVRASHLIYLDAVRQKLEKTRETSDNTPPVFDFHWVDWVDMSDLEPLIIEKPNCFVGGVLGSNVRTEWHDCIDVKGNSPHELNFYFDRPATRYESEYRLALRGKTYLYSVAPIPKKLIFITGEAAFVVKTKDSKSLLENGMIKSFIDSTLKLNSDITLTEEHIKEQPISAEGVFGRISKELGRDLRDFNTPPSQYADVTPRDFDTIVKKIRKSKVASQAARAGQKHFHDSMVEGSNNNFDAPYDWRFFKKTLSPQKHRASLHHTVRAWLSLNSNLGLTSWIDEDLAVSWMFNGMVAPFQKTIKFRMPSKEISKLGTYNHSLIVDDPLMGSGSYLLDLSPHFIERARLNDPMKAPDAVDARFIDISTGVYIELYGVMSSDATLPQQMVEEFGKRPRTEFFNSGDGRFYHQSDLLPIKRTLFEGKVANVAGNALKLISQYNHETVNTKLFEEYRYQDHLRLWISRSKCNYVPQEDINIYAEGGSSFIGACHDVDIWEEFNRTKAASAFRQKEVTAETQLSIGAKDQMEAFYPDYWLLDRVQKLNKEYGYPLS